MEAYRQTGMGRSFSKAGAQIPAGKLYHAASDRYYEITGNRMTRYQQGPAGHRVNETEKSIDYAVGSGNHARTFLHRNPDGSLIELPVSWYSEKGGALAMSPGYDRPDHDDFRRRVPEDCMFCHNAYPRKHNALPEGIDCQRCHGPASDHNSLVNPAKLSRDRQLDVCEQCHLEPTSSPPPSVVRRPERRPNSYKPGQSLTDYAVFFEAGIGDRFEVAHQGYRLRKSACFIKSAMTCTTCHDPHRAQPVSHFIDVCKSCHAAAHRAQEKKENCLECHMWQRRTDDAPHVIMTDHYIQRRKPVLFASGAVTERVPYFANENPGPQSYQRGIDASKSGDYSTAIHFFEQAIRENDNPEESRREIGAALMLSGNLSASIEQNEKLPGDPIALANLGNAYLQTGRIDDAKRVLAKAPDEPNANNLLGLACLKSGDTAAAESAFRRALNLQPDLAEANNNLGTLLASRHNYAEAVWYFGKAVASNPANAEFRHSFGLTLALTRDYRKARAELEEALRLAPNSAEIRSDLDDVRRSAR
ncbi:MAG TPA: tetratricopeptide repeat protein [Bryobacteraceae bacterium]|nr:tetratricopeptide repeat protein [Bryobacteraceae bacterium]